MEQRERVWLECYKQSEQWRWVVRTLTDGSLHNHSFRVGGTQAVSSSVDCLDSKHVVYPGSQAMAHKPENSMDKGVKSLVLSIHFDFIDGVRNSKSFKICNCKN